MPLSKLMLPTLILMALLALFLLQSRRVQAVRRITSKTVLVAFACGTFFAGLVVFLAILNGGFVPFGDDREFENMTYDQYASVVGVNGLDPKGAWDISYRSHSTRDSYDVWLKLSLPSAGYDLLLAKMSASLEDPHFVSTQKNNSIPATKTVSRSPDLPSNWPGPEVNPPSWFETAEIGDPVQCTQWDVQLVDRAKGWYWLYDLDSETLRIWEWNRQHFKIR